MVYGVFISLCPCPFSFEWISQHWICQDKDKTSNFLWWSLYRFVLGHSAGCIPSRALPRASFSPAWILQDKEDKTSLFKILYEWHVEVSLTRSFCFVFESLYSCFSCFVFESLYSKWNVYFAQVILNLNN